MPYYMKLKHVVNTLKNLTMSMSTTEKTWKIMQDVVTLLLSQVHKSL